MNVLHPGFLLGILSVAAPLLLHLLKRRQIRQVDFPTLRFFHLVRRKASMLLRVGNLLLLVLRCSLLVLVTLLFAQPFFVAPGLRDWNSVPRSLVVLLDNSASTAARRPDGSRIHAALLEAVKGWLKGSDARDQLTVVSLSPRAEVVYAGHPGQLARIRLPEPTAAGADFAGGLGLAEEAFARGGGDRVLVIASDFQAGDWAQDLPARLPTASLFLVRPPDLPRSNRALTAVEEDGFRPVVGETWGLRVEVEQHGLAGAAAGVEVRLVAHRPDGRQVLAAAAVPDQAEASLRLETRFASPGPVSLSVELVGGGQDACVEDDAVQLLVEVRAARRMLVWNGDPRAAEVDDELFYLRRAARAGGFDLDEIGAARELEFKDPAGYQAFHLANVPDPRPARDFVEKLLEAQGAVVAWLGAKADEPAWNSFGPLAERSLGLRGRASRERPGPWRAAGGGGGGAFASLKTPKFWSGVQAQGYWFLETGNRLDASALLATHEDGTPAVAAFAAGRGWLVLVNGGADLEDSDLPMHPIFPVLVRRLGMASDGPMPRYQAGDLVSLEVDRRGTPEATAVLAPGGRQVPLTAALVGRSRQAAFRETAQTGIYRVVRGGVEAEAFTVRADPRESRLEPIAEEALGRIFPGAERDPLVRPVASGGFRLRELLLLAIGLVLLAEASLVGYLERPAAPPSSV